MNCLETLRQCYNFWNRQFWRVISDNRASALKEKMETLERQLQEKNQSIDNLIISTSIDDDMATELALELHELQRDYIKEF